MTAQAGMRGVNLSRPTPSTPTPPSAIPEVAAQRRAFGYCLICGQSSEADTRDQCRHTIKATPSLFGDSGLSLGPHTHHLSTNRLEIEGIVAMILVTAGCSILYRFLSRFLLLDHPMLLINLPTTEQIRSKIWRVTRHGHLLSLP